MSNTALNALVLIAAAATAAAQTPVFTPLSIQRPTDVTNVGGVIVAVGNDGSSTFRWTDQGGSVNIGGDSGAVGMSPRVSLDGVKISGAKVGPGGISSAAIWDGTMWTSIPGIGGSSGTTETTAYGISGDGNWVVGLGWTVSAQGRGFKWSSGTGSIAFGQPIDGGANRGNDVNSDGSIIVGWQDLLNGTRQGARWVNGTQIRFTYTDPNNITFKCGEALATNSDASTIVGYNIFGGPGGNAWRWDASSGVVTLLPNVAGNPSNPLALDVTDDGTKIVGIQASAPFGWQSVIWINNQPQSLYDYLVSLGTQGLGGFTDLGLPAAIARDGSAIVGFGSGGAFGQPDGWIVTFPGALLVGTPYCSGDGSATACPCGNSGAPGNGCANSVNANGGKLEAYGGGASLSNDVIVLKGSGMPNAPCLYFQGTAQQNGGMGNIFGDGLRCVTGSIVRLKTTNNVNGASQFPAAGDLQLSVKGLITTPGLRDYQIWYRNAANFCVAAATFNLTNGLELNWVP